MRGSNGAGKRGSLPEMSDFPRLTEFNSRTTSPRDVGYNCVAWSAGDTTRWWQPGVYWPVETSRDDYSVGALEQAFQSLGYEDCPDKPTSRVTRRWRFTDLGSSTRIQHVNCPTENGPAS